MKKINQLILGLGVLSILLFSPLLALAVPAGDPCPVGTECDEGLLCVAKVCTAGYGVQINCEIPGNEADALICKVMSTLGLVFSLVLILAVLYFVWGIVQYVTAGGDEEKSAAAKKTMMYGIIALAVIVGVGGILRIVTGYVGLEGAIRLPFIGG